MSARLVNEFLAEAEGDPEIRERLRQQLAAKYGCQTEAEIARAVADDSTQGRFLRALAECWLAMDASRSPDERVQSCIEAQAHNARIQSGTLEWEFVCDLYFITRMSIPGERVDLGLYAVVVRNAEKHGWFLAPSWAATYASGVFQPEAPRPKLVAQPAA